MNSNLYTLKFLKVAKKDMENIVYYISHKLKNRSAALNLANQFVEYSKSLLNFPYKNKEYITLKPLKRKYRSIKVKNFIMFYTIDEKKKIIIITRVLYKRKDFDNILN